MAKNLWLKKFDPSDNFKWRKNCGEYVMGSKVNNKLFTERRLQQLYTSRIIVAADVYDEFVGAESPAPDKGRVVADSAPVSDAAKQLEELGVKVDGRWSEARINEELEKATAPSGLPGV